MTTIFWNVDTQYDFMRSDGKLYVKGAEGIEKNLDKLTKLADYNNIKVVNTADWHIKTSKELSVTPDFIRTFPEHCMQYTRGAEFVPATNPGNPYKIDWKQATFDETLIKNKRNIILYKDEFDIFTGTPHVERVLEILRPERAFVYGVATNVCVDFAVKGLLNRKVKVYAVTDAMKELPNLPLEKVLNEWRKKGAKLVRTDQVQGILEDRL